MLFTDFEDSLGDARFSANLMVLMGQKRCGKTSLGFHYAFNHVVENGTQVWFCCVEEKIKERLPVFPNGKATPSEAVMGSIQMKYIKTYNDLYQILGTVQELPESKRPKAIVIDDFNDLFGDLEQQIRSNTIARALGVLEDTITWLNGVGVIVIDEGSFSRSAYLFQRTVPLVLQLSQQTAKDTWTLHVKVYNHEQIVNRGVDYCITDMGWDVL